MHTAPRRSHGFFCRFCIGILKLVPIGKSTIYADINTGKLSADFNARGHKIVDTAELDSVYGLEKQPGPNGKPTGNENGIDRKAVETNQNTDESTQNVAFLQREVARLESELEQLKSAKRNSKHTPINS